MVNAIRSIGYCEPQKIDNDLTLHMKRVLEVLGICFSSFQCASSAPSRAWGHAQRELVVVVAITGVGGYCCHLVSRWREMLNDLYRRSHLHDEELHPKDQYRNAFSLSI